MSTIRESEKGQQRLMEGVKRKHKLELEQQQDMHQKLKAESKNINESELVNLQHQHEKQLTTETERKEKVLTQMNEQLQKTKDLTDKEINSLKEKVIKSRQQEFDKFSLERDRIQSENELHLQELVHRYNSKIKEVNQEGQSNLTDLTSNSVREYSQQRDHQQGRINGQHQEFNSTFRQNEASHSKLKNQQERQFKQERLSTHQKQQNELSKLTDQQRKDLAEKDMAFRKSVKAQEELFEKKWAETLNKHNLSYRELNQGHEKTVNQLKDALSAEINSSHQRADEPFYQFTELKPLLKHHADRVEISLPVPEYAKDDFSLTINGREAIVNFHRRFQDVKKQDDGIIKKLNKVESYSTRMPTDYILNPKSILAQYADGIMTYTVKKA